MANSAVVGLLRVILRMDSAEFTEGVRLAQREMQAWSTSLNKFGRDATQLGQALTKTLTLPILAVGAGAAKAAIDFESSFAGVRKTVNATEGEFAQMAQAFRNLAKEIPVNVNELNRLGEAAGALGIPKAEIVDFAKTMALLGVTTNVTADQAAESIAQIQTIFKSAGKETENFASTLVDLGNNGASTEANILALANRIASAGNAVGLSQAQVLGFSSAIANVGIEAEAGGTAISKVFSDMSIAVSHGGDDLKAFAKIAGQSASGFAQMFKTDAAGAVTAFVEGLGRAKDAGGDLNLILEDLGFKEVRQARALRDLALSGHNLAGSLDIAGKAWQANTALTAEAGKRFETTASQMTLLWNRITDVGITIGNALLPAIRSAVELVGQLLPFIDKLAKGFADLPGPIQLTVIGILGLAAAAGPALILVGQMALGLGALTKAFTAQGIATTTATATLGPYATGVLAVGRALASAIPYLAAFAGGALIAAAHTEHLDRLSDSAKDLAQANELITAKQKELNQALANGNDALAFKLRAELKALEAGKAAGEQAKKAADQTAEAARIAAFASFNYDQLKTSATGAGHALGKSGDDAKELTKALKSLKDAQADVIVQAKAWVQFAGTDVQKLPIKVQQDYLKVLQDVIDAHGSLGKAGLGSFQLIYDALDSVVGKGKDVKKILAEAGEAAREQLEKISKDATAKLPPVMDKFKELGDGIKAAADVARDSFNAVATNYDKLIEEANVYRTENLAAIAPLKKTIPAIYEQARMGVEAEYARMVEAAGASAMQQVHVFQQIMGQLPDVILQAVSGGGNVGKTVATFLGNSLIGDNNGAGLTGPIGKALEGGLGALFKKTASGGIAEGILNGISNAIPGLGPLIGAGLGMAFSGLKKLGGAIANALGIGKGAGRSMIEEFAAGFDSSQSDNLSGFDDLHKKLLTLGDEGERLWRNLGNGTKRDKDKAQAAINEITAAFERQEQVLSKYGLTLDDLQTPQQKFGASIKALGDDLTSLQGMGFDNKTIVGVMADDLNKVALAAIETGQKLPAAFGPLLEQLAAAGLVSDELQRKLLGIADPAPWKDMEAIANEFGISLDALGQGFKDAKLDETATEFAEKFMLLVDNGADVNAVIAGMGEQAQEFFLQARRWGVELPAAMKPLIAKLIETGELVDENGEKVTDLGSITFKKDPAEMLQPLTDALLLLVEALTTKLPQAAEDGANGVRKAFLGGFRVPVTFESPTYTPGSQPTGGESEHSYANGSGSFLNFGTGTRAMLHGREQVVTEGEGRDLASMLHSAVSSGGGGGVVYRDLSMNVNGRTFYRETLPDLMDVLRQAQVTR